MKWPGWIVLNIVLIAGAGAARAQLVIEITEGLDNPTAIAVVPFSWQGEGAAPEDIAAVIDSDLMRVGQFAPVERNNMLGRPSRASEVYFRRARAV